MNHNEIEACVIRAKRGNEEDLLKILEQYKAFIFKTALAFNIKGYDTYDLAQIGYITLINAVTKYKIGSHTFSSYAYTAIKNEFKYVARRNSKASQDLSLNTPLDDSENTNSEFIDCIEATENIEEDLIKIENTKEVRQALTKLTEEELELVIMVYYNKVPIKVYAEKKNISYIQAIRRKNKILEKLSKFLKK